MTEQRSFRSPLAPPGCALQLQDLAAQSIYEVTERSRATRLTISRLRLVLRSSSSPGDDYAFRLRVRARDNVARGLLGITLFLAVRGELMSAEAGTQVQLTVGPGRPVTVRGWLLQALRYALPVLMFGALLLKALQNGDAILWQLAGVVLLAAAALHALLGIVHSRVARAAALLIERSLVASTGRNGPPRLLPPY